MSRAGFYSDNELRNYPFVGGDTGVAIPTQSVVDFGCIMGPASGFVTGVHKVWLSRVSRSDRTFRFEYKTDAPGLVGRSLVFEFYDEDPEYTTRFAQDDIELGSTASLTSIADPCGADVNWEGYMVIGKLLYTVKSFTNLAPGVILWNSSDDGMLWQSPASYLLEQVLANPYGSSDEDFDGSGATQVEPALIQNLSSIYVRQISLANSPRTKATPPTVCDSSSSRTPEPNYINFECLKGRIKVVPGYNCEIIVNDSDNSITVSGLVGAGEGQACDEPKLYSSEVPPEGSNLLSGGPECKDILKTINGLGGKTVNIVGGLGVTVSEGVTPNTIVITPDHHGMALCASFVTSSVGG